MSDKKIIAVVGGTGNQGGGLVRAILDDTETPFVARVLTRDTHSPKAKEFGSRGAEVVRTDLDDEASLRAAFDGAYGAFVVTNYYEQRTPEQQAGRGPARIERDQAENAARAAKSAGLRHVVWSTLEDTRPYFAHFGSDVPDIEDDYKVPHFDAKAEANRYFTALGVPTTFLEAAIFYESFTAARGPRRDPDGRLVMRAPIGDSTIALVGAEDIGRTAYGIFLAGVRFIGRTVGLAATHATGDQLAEIFSRVLGEKVVFQPLSYDELRASGRPNADEYANMYQFYSQAADSFIGNRDLDLVRAINPRLKSYEQWLAEHRDALQP